MIYYKRLVFNPFQVNTWLVYKDDGACVIIDPACSDVAERKMLLDFISTMKLKPELILATHGHFDHLPGVYYLWDKFEIPFYGHKEDFDLLKLAGKQGEMYGFVFDLDPPDFDYFLVDGEELLWGGGAIRCLHVPGHSRGSLAFHFEDSGFVATGDVLFNNSIGRTDLLGGDYDTLINSIRSKLLVMDDETIVLSGHGPETTIGEEKNSNPFL